MNFLACVRNSIHILPFAPHPNCHLLDCTRSGRDYMGDFRWFVELFRWRNGRELATNDDGREQNLNRNFGGSPNNRNWQREKVRGGKGNS